ncbi:hypothetical protein [Prolixibacter bellariivorans]|uniref:hypothetical protein n=1 Tax=Prolixibacter bellariivorans TaxID=314319 RepID=UPI000A539FC4|nr:hypothetical protein [Prolixibacter bellariivorans]
MKLQRIYRDILWAMAFIIMTFTANAQSKTSVKIALLKYGGGGDWYANPTSLGDLIQYCNKNIGTNIDPELLPLMWEARKFSITRSWI